MLSIRLLGPPRIQRDGQTIAVRRRKSRALVYYLASHGRPLSRERLLAFFWPDLDRPAAQQTLRTTLHGLRKTLGEALATDADEVAIDPEAEVDARVFEAGVTAPDPDLAGLAAAIDLYRGDFLADFRLPDTPRFEDWASVERERLRRLAVRGLSRCSRLHEAGGDYAAALSALDQALAFDPLQEDLQRAALRLHYLSGDRTAAIRRYDALRQMLDEEMGVPPMAETRRLYDAIVNDALPAAGDPGASRPASVAVRPAAFPALPFTGRRAELEALRELAAAGANRLALIEGEPGIGKTRLAEAFLAASEGWVLAGKARELEQSLPYLPIIEALRGLTADPGWPDLAAAVCADTPAIWLAEIARLLPELAGGQPDRFPAPGPVDESRLWEGVYQFLEALSRRRATYLFVDDLQWADAATLALLGYLLHREAGAARGPIIFLAAIRSDAEGAPLAALLRTLARERRLHRLPLDRLSREETRALARQLSPDYSPPLADWLARNSEGNPYILAELVRHAREHRILLDDGAVDLSALSSAPTLPHTVYTLIQSRLARLSDGARRVLDAAVAVGREFEYAVVAHAAGLSEQGALDAIDELRDAGLISPAAPGAERFTFDHSLTMEVAYQEVGEPRHRLLHRRVAEAMEGIYRDRIDAVAGPLASHFAEGRAPDRAAPYAMRAARLASGLAAWKEAAGFYELAAAGQPEAEREEALLALGEAASRSGEVARAVDAFRAALKLAEARWDERAVDQARLALGQVLLTQARFGEAVGLARATLAAGRAESRARAEALWGTALSVEGADLASAADHLHAAEDALGEAGDPAALAQVKFELGSVAAQRGELREAVALYEQALEAARQTESGFVNPFEVLAHNNLAYHLSLLGDSSAVDHARIGLQLAQDAGILGLQTYLHSTLGDIALAQDDVDLAEQHFREALDLAERFSVPERVAGLNASLGLVAQRRGQAALAVHRLSTGLARADAIGTLHLAAQIRLWLAPLLPPAEARAHLDEALAIAQNSGRRRLLEEAKSLEKKLFSS